MWTAERNNVQKTDNNNKNKAAREKATARTKNNYCVFRKELLCGCCCRFCLSFFFQSFMDDDDQQHRMWIYCCVNRNWVANVGHSPATHTHTHIYAVCAVCTVYTPIMANVRSSISPSVCAYDAPTQYRVTLFTFYTNRDWVCVWLLWLLWFLFVFFLSSWFHLCRLINSLLVFWLIYILCGNGKIIRRKIE